MNFNFEKALQISGSFNFYQKFLLLTSTLIWFSIQMLPLSIALLELQPNFECKNDEGLFIPCTKEQACKVGKENFIRIITYHNPVTKFQLECKTDFIILMGVIFIVGCIIGVFLGSIFSDILGRKPVIATCVSFYGIVIILIGFINNIYISAGALFCLGLTFGGSTMIILFTSEIINTKYRSITNALIGISNSIAGIVYFTVCYYFRDWKYLNYISSAGSIISAVLIISYFVESPRYDLYKGKTSNGIKSLLIIAKKNGKLNELLEYLISLKESESEQYFDEARKLNSNFSMEQSKLGYSENNINLSNSNQLKTEYADSIAISTHIDSPVKKNVSVQEIIKNIDLSHTKQELLVPPSENPSNTKKSNKNLYGLSALVKLKSIRYVFLSCCCIWFVCEFVANGMNLGLKKNTSKVFIDGYTVFGSDVLCNLLTGIIISISFFGRTRTLSIMMLITSISTAGYYVVNLLEFNLNDVILLGISRFGMTSVHVIMNTYTIEVYPTAIRAKGIGVNSLVSKIGLVFVPVIVELLDPFIIFSSLCFIAFLLSICLPETFGKDLEDEVIEDKII